MRNPSESNGTKYSTSATPAFDKLTKAELIQLLYGNITQPITPGEFYRAAVSIVARWCNDVISGNYASMYNVTSKLDAIKDIYRNQ